MYKCDVCGRELRKEMGRFVDNGKWICWNCYFEAEKEGLFMGEIDSIEVLKILRRHGCKILDSVFDVATAKKIFYMYGRVRGFEGRGVDVGAIFSSDDEGELKAAAEEITDYLVERYSVVTWREYKILEIKEVEVV